MSLIVEAVDGVYGRQAAGLWARLWRCQGASWEAVAVRETGSDGLICGLSVNTGLYRLVFDVDRYFVGMGLSAGYSEVTATFHVRNDSTAYRIHVAVSPHNCSTQLVAY